MSAQNSQNLVQDAQQGVQGAAQETPQDAIIDAESAALLAKLDARGVAESKLMRVFRCSAEELGLCREVEVYKDAFAAETLAIEERAAQLDDSWDDIEAKSLGDLKEQMMLGTVVDPRQLLSTAATANKMGRRAAGLTANGVDRAKAEASRPVLDGTPQVVIRLRTRFVEQIDNEDGHKSLLAREAEVISSASGDMNDDVGAAEMRSHIEGSLGINLASLKTGGRSGPDQALESLMQSGEKPGGRFPDMFAQTLTDGD